MKISIVTPCYNSEKYIEETIESVISQKGNFEVEYILIDAQSIDNTLEIINDYKKKIESGIIKIRCDKVSIIVISEKDEGMYDAIHKGLNLTTGDIIAYINSDDYYLPNAFMAVKTVFESYRNIDWITGVINGYNEFGNITLSKLPYKYNSGYIEKGIYGNVLPFIQQESCFWRKSLLQKINLKKFSTFKLAGDFFLWHEFARYVELRILNVPISGFRKHGLNKSTDITSYFEEFNSIISKKVTYKDKLQLFLEKRKWDESSEKKLKLNQEIIDLSQNRLRYLLEKNNQNNLITINNQIEEKTSSPNIFVSVITVTYNAQEFLERTINSVIIQENCEFEYIIIDGASTDNTKKIIKNYESKIDFCLSEPDDGLYDAMNKGIQNATGEYIIFMNAGDTFSDDCTLENIKSVINLEVDDVVYGDRYYIHQDGRKDLQKAKPIESVFKGMPFGHQSCLVKTKILKTTPFNITYKYAADYNLIIELYQQEKNFKYVNFPVCNFLHGGTSESGLRPYLEALKVVFDNCDDVETIRSNQYFKSFKRNSKSLLDI